MVRNSCPVNSAAGLDGAEDDFPGGGVPQRRRVLHSCRDLTDRRAVPRGRGRAGKGNGSSRPVPSGVQEWWPIWRLEGPQRGADGSPGHAGTFRAPARACTGPGRWHFLGACSSACPGAARRRRRAWTAPSTETCSPFQKPFELRTVLTLRLCSAPTISRTRPANQAIAVDHSSNVGSRIGESKRHRPTTLELEGRRHPRTLAHHS